MLIQIILTFIRDAARRSPPVVPVAGGALRDDSDPLSHPEIARMTPAELADLPFDRMGAATPDRVVQREERAACEGVQERADGCIMACPECA